MQKSKLHTTVDARRRSICQWYNKVSLVHLCSAFCRRTNYFYWILPTRLCHVVIGGLLTKSRHLNRTIPSVDVMSRLYGRHFPVMKESTSAKRKCSAKPCRLFQAKDIRTATMVPETRWICLDMPWSTRHSRRSRMLLNLSHSAGPGTTNNSQTFRL